LYSCIVHSTLSSSVAVSALARLEPSVSLSSTSVALSV
jgi:hypothetical protein